MRIWSVFLIEMKIEIPDYRLREWHTHLLRIVENAVCDPSDTRTANALRMARKDLCRMEKYIKNTNQK